MRDSIAIGPTPCDEECAQVGTDDYTTRAKEECKRFITLIRKVCGMEPEGARLIVKGNPHDFGTYYEVECSYDDRSEKAMEYAFKVESESPATWQG